MLFSRLTIPTAVVVFATDPPPTPQHHTAKERIKESA